VGLGGYTEGGYAGEGKLGDLPNLKRSPKLPVVMLLQIGGGLVQLHLETTEYISEGGKSGLLRPQSVLLNLRVEDILSRDSLNV
jgi:hypothetical protein